MKTKRTSKQIWITLMSMAVLLLCSVIPALASAGENGAETIVVGVPIDRCPLFYLNPDTKEITGIGVDLMQYAAQEAGFEAEFTAINEETLKDALDSSDYDVIMPFGSNITSTSGKESIVSENLLQSPFTLATEDGRNTPSLNSLHVGMLHSQAGVAETVSQLFPGIEISLYDEMSACVKALRSGSVDALLHNSYVWSYVLQKPS